MLFTGSQQSLLGGSGLVVSSLIRTLNVLAAILSLLAASVTATPWTSK